MCRICGFIDFANVSSKEENANILHSMRDVMQIGGPDDAGIYLETNENFVIGFGHRRLSIIDVSSGGHQPMMGADGNIVIVFNGEIYNYQEIRKKLEAEQIFFRTNSDTEVIINAYCKWGINCVKQFIGMFAFCLFDKTENKIYLVRDRAGVKPLHYYFRNNVFLFSSEIKAFHQHPKFEKTLNAEALSLFFKYGAIPAPYSIFENVLKVNPGLYVTLDLANKSISEMTYWNVFDSFAKNQITVSEEEAIEETENLLKSACNYRMVADVPVGVFLSGGYDSSLVTAILQKNRTAKIKTFSIGFSETQYDESVYAKKIANYLGTDHTEYICSEKHIVDLLPLMPQIYDEPFGDDSAIPTYLVSKIARQQVKVALSADGGDEVFGGYDKYTDVIRFYHQYKRIPSFIRRSTADFIRFSKIDKKLAGYDFDFLARKTSLIERISDTSSMAIMMHQLAKTMDDVAVGHKLLRKKNRNENLGRFAKEISINGTPDSNINRMLAFDYVTYLPDTILTKVDRATMANSLEGREPLLDHRLVEWASTLPASLKIKGGRKKYLLKQIAHKYIPQELLERPKKGFSLPVSSWLNTSLKSYLDYYLDKKRIEENGILNYSYVQRIKKSAIPEDKRSVQNLWNILMFQMWFEKWMK